MQTVLQTAPTPSPSFPTSAMSGYYVGPFGRMLPVADDPSSTQPPEQPANRSEPGDNPYQLPPPRTLGNLQFGSDPFLRQRQQGEDAEPGRRPGAPEAAAQPQMTEQLPSVRQLLTPAAGPSSPPTYQQPFGTPTPSIEHREPSYGPRHHDPTFSSQTSPVPAPHQLKGRSESFPQPQSSTLPPLAHVAMHSPREVHHAGTRSDVSTASYPGRAVFQGTPVQDKTVTRDVSSPESMSRSQGSSSLSHVVNERFIEGEGICYVYADGTHVPKAIDGIPVNANWGITKAGKPRKRLAQACLTCREKKIKCQPNLPKCDQCQKSGRECRFESAPRGSRSSLRGSHSAGLSGKYEGKEAFSPGLHHTADSSPSMYNIPRASNSATSLAGTSGHSPTSEGPILTPSGTEGAFETISDADRAYRQRIYRPPRAFSGDDSIPRPLEYTETSRQSEYPDIIGDIQDVSHDNSLAAYWAIDPYESDPETTVHYVESYMAHVNDGLYHIFPSARFVLWLKSCPSKSIEDKMLLYAMMALGAVFSARPDRLMALRRYSRIARFAVMKSQYALSLQLAQSHLILGILYYATGSLVGSWDSIGAAGRVVSGLRYNVESGGVIVDQSQISNYGLHVQALIECRRRTFWFAFILERASSFFSASSTLLSSETALIRLPCREEIYESQQYATALYFQPSLNPSPPSEDDRSALSPMAFLIQIMSIWSDVSLQALRLAHAPSESYVQLAEQFHINITRRVQEWTTQLPEHLVFSSINMDRAAQTKQTDTFVLIHMFYHATLMKLYRHARYQSLQPEILVQYIHRARYHAVETLRIALAVVQYNTELQSRASADPSIPAVTLLGPFVGYMALSAVDILSAAGLVTDLADSISFIRGAHAMIQFLGRYWDSSLDLLNAIQRRLNLMIDCVNEQSRAQDRIGFAVDGPSLETKVHAAAIGPHPPAPSDEDLFCGSMPREMLVQFLRTEDFALAENSIVWLRDP